MKELKVRISSNYTQLQSNRSFGYDKALNKELTNRLKTYPDQDWAKTLDAMNKNCNTLEKKLAKTENDKNDTKHQEYMDIFLTMKQMLAGFVSITFEDMFYADKEYDHFNDEFIKHGSKEDDWRKEACYYLSEWCECKHDIPKPIEPTKVVYVKDENNDDEIDAAEETITVGQTPVSSTKGVASTDPTQLKRGSLLEKFEPSETSPKGFCDVAGMDSLKKDLQNTIVQMINNPEQAKLDYEEYGKKMPRGVLLYGPPGCGKTYISEALSSEIDTPLYMLSIGKAGSSYINATSNNIKSAFDEAISIAEKTKKPILLFMDEIDSVGFDRKEKTWAEDIKQVATLLQSMDKAENSGVILLAATNKYQLLDPAVRRRFDNKSFVDVPDEKSREALVKNSLLKIKKGQNLASDDKAISQIAEKLNGYSNDSICKISKAAALNALDRDRADIAVEDFEKALKETSEEKPNREEYLNDSASDEGKRIKGFVRT